MKKNDEAGKPDMQIDDIRREHSLMICISEKTLKYFQAIRPAEFHSAIR